MELRRHLQILVAYRWIVLAGLVVGAALAFLSVFSVSFSGGPKADYRQNVIYASTSTVYVTQAGFPEGRILAQVAADPDEQARRAQTGETRTPFFADPARFANLALLYSFLLSSTEIQSMISNYPSGAEILPAAVTSGSGSKAQTLPLLQIETRAANTRDAMQLNGRAIDALKRYVTARQQENAVPDRDRVQLLVVTPPKRAVVAEGRSYTAAIVLFLLAAMVGIGLAYVLENLRRPVDAEGAALSGPSSTTPATTDADVKQPFYFDVVESPPVAEDYRPSDEPAESPSAVAGGRLGKR